MDSFLLIEHSAGAIYDPPMGPPVYTRAVTPFRRPYKTQDGYVSVLVYNDKQWRRFTELAQRPDLAADARFRSQADRSANMPDFCTIVAEILAQRTTAEWLDLLDQAEIPFARLNSTADLSSHPHLAHVGFFQPLADTPSGKLHSPLQPV